MKEKLEWAQLWDAMDSNPEDWILTTETMYWNMLEVLPPRAWGRDCFLVGEPLRHDSDGKAVHACFKKSGDSYLARNLTVKQFNELTK